MTSATHQRRAVLGQCNAQQVIAKALTFAVSAPLPKGAALSGPLELNGAGDIDLRLREQTVTSPELQLAGAEPAAAARPTASVKMNSNVAVNLVSRQLALTGLRGNAQLSGDPIKGAALPVSFAGDVTADLPAQWVQVANLKLSAEGLNLAGDVRAESITGSPVFTGTVAAPQFALDQLLARAGNRAAGHARSEGAEKRGVQRQVQIRRQAAVGRAGQP